MNWCLPCLYLGTLLPLLLCCAGAIKTWCMSRIILLYSEGTRVRVISCVDGVGDGLEDLANVVAAVDDGLKTRRVSPGGTARVPAGNTQGRLGGFRAAV